MSSVRPAVCFRRALEIVERVMRENQPRHGETWRSQPVGVHLRHAEEHLGQCCDCGRSRSARSKEDHLAHAATRVLMALQMREQME